MQISLRPKDPFEVRRTLLTVSGTADAATVAAALDAELVRCGYQTERPREGVITFRFPGMAEWIRKNGHPDALFTRGCITVAPCPTGEVMVDVSLRFDSRFVVGYILFSLLIAVGLLPFWPMRLGMVLVFVLLFEQTRGALIQNFMRGIGPAAPFRDLEPPPPPPALAPGER